MYVVSKNYDELYNHIYLGDKVCCTVDYDFYRDGKPPVRDFCICKRPKKNTIMFSVRGMQYGGVDAWLVDGKETEKDLFIDECKSLNVEWFKP